MADAGQPSSHLLGLPTAGLQDPGTIRSAACARVHLSPTVQLSCRPALWPQLERSTGPLAGRLTRDSPGPGTGRSRSRRATPSHGKEEGSQGSNSKIS